MINACHLRQPNYTLCKVFSFHHHEIYFRIGIALTMFVFKIIIFICLYEHVGDAEGNNVIPIFQIYNNKLFSVLTVSLRDHNMWLRDHFGGVTNLFISGRNLTFPCVCEQEACKRMVVKLDTDTKVKSDGKERKYHELPMTLTHNTEFGEYICETNNVKSKTLKLNYLLCKHLV